MFLAKSRLAIAWGILQSERLQKRCRGNTETVNKTFKSNECEFETFVVVRRVSRMEKRSHLHFLVHSLLRLFLVVFYQRLVLVLLPVPEEDFGSSPCAIHTKLQARWHPK